MKYRTFYKICNFDKALDVPGLMPGTFVGRRTRL
jgi:hypothetical protein